MRSTLSVLLMVGLLAAPVLAAPAINSAVEHFRVFNDRPGSDVTFNDNYPSSIFIQDVSNDANGWANLHTWRFSENNFTDAQFANADAFSFSANLVISGGANAEAGLQISPWWSPQVDGRLNVRVPDGEIAAFGGRLPFYSFTGNYGLHYVMGDTIGLSMTYDPHGLSALDPATIEYKVTYNSTVYSSGPLAFDQGNPAEDPPHGQWGILNPAYAGAHFQAFNGTTGTARADWTNINFTPEPGTLALVVLGGLALARRRS
jgi:hypothetical protein